MKKNYLIYFFATIIITFIVSSCLVEPKFPNEPTIKFKAVNMIYDASPDIEDSIGISIDFQDGDGDLGLNQPDEEDPRFGPTIEVINPDTGESETVSNPDFYNFFISILVKNAADEFEQFTIPGGQVLDGRFPRLDNTGKAKPLEGTILYHLKMTPGFQGNLAGKVIKFKVSIQDRALHKSNEVETDTLLIPEF